MYPLPPPKREAPTATTGTDEQNHHQSNRAVDPQTSSITIEQPQGSSSAAASDGKKKRKHRGGKKRKKRRQSFAAPSETSAIQSIGEGISDDPLIQINEDRRVSQAPFYRRQTNLSDDSLDSDALLDHRDQYPVRTRRESRLTPTYPASRRNAPFGASYFSSADHHDNRNTNRKRGTQSTNRSELPSDGGNEVTDQTPLIGSHSPQKTPIGPGYGLFRTKSHNSTRSSGSKSKFRRANTTNSSFPKFDQEYDVNNPPSVPASPVLESQFDDVMVSNGDFMTRSPESRRNLQSFANDALIDIDGDTAAEREVNSAPTSPGHRPINVQRARSVALPVEGDVCFPGDEDLDLGDEEYANRLTGTYTNTSQRRRRRREWPQLWVFDEWSREEKEERAGERRAKKISEPVFVEGRLRPSKNAWHRNEEDYPYRYTYFNEEFESTIHSQTISELVQPGSSFRELFIPDPPILSESESSDDDEDEQLEMVPRREESAGLVSPKSQVTAEEGAGNTSRLNSMLSEISKSRDTSGKTSNEDSGHATPLKVNTALRPPKPKKYGPRPTFWLDVMSPSDREMRVLCKAFGIHALTSEDIMMQEAREKVELFKNYYFINYRTFEQDTNSEDYLEAINMYVCVFRQGVISFHFSQSPHPANVRRRIRQLKDYLILSADWISYAIIDDITDVYQPLITNIEEEVDDIDDLILSAFQDTDELSKDSQDNDEKEKQSNAGENGSSGIDMLRRIGECRKKVMSLYRLLGNKADVIKGFAKRCNEQWEVAPKSEIGLYLGDIQDHILTMTSNLSHYETLLSRAHSNYLAQVSIRMNERQEQTADVLGKLTVVGTIVLPMNIICGMWGMNVKVPGQDIDNLYWFWSITAGLVLFAVVCFYWCKRVYGIV